MQILFLFLKPLGPLKMKNKIYIIFRNDDPCALSDPKRERRILELFERYHIPQVLAVIPKDVDDPHNSSVGKYHPLEENPEMVTLLKEYQQKGLIEIAQHGYTHQTNKYHPSINEATAQKNSKGIDKQWLGYNPSNPEGYSEFSGLSKKDQREKIVQGKNYLEKIFNSKLETFIFPWNTYDQTSLEVLKEQGFKFVPAEDDEMLVSGICTIGCCYWHWQIDSFIKTIKSIGAPDKAILIQFGYHSWMPTEDEIKQLEDLFKLLKANPYVEFILPKDVPRVTPWALKIIPLRTRLRKLVQGINEYFDHKIDIPKFYIEDYRFYFKRILKLSPSLFVMKHLGLKISLVAILGAACLFVWSIKSKNYVLGLIDIFVLLIIMGMGGFCFILFQKCSRSFRSRINQLFNIKKQFLELIFNFRLVNQYFYLSFLNSLKSFAENRPGIVFVLNDNLLYRDNDDSGRYPYLILNAFNSFGFNVFLYKNITPVGYKRLSTYGRLIYSIQNLKIIDQIPNETQNLIYAFDFPDSQLLKKTWKKTIYINMLKPNYFCFGNVYWIPYDLHPFHYKLGYDKNIPQWRNLKKNLRIFFGGNTTVGYYDNPNLKRYKQLTRREAIEVILKEVPEARIVQNVNNFCQELAKTEKINECLLLKTNETPAASYAQWMEILAKTEFFLCLSGTDLPICHNTIEAMSLGVIPILGYQDWFYPSLEHMKNAVIYSNKDDLVEKIKEVLNLPEEKIRDMRRNVLEYYDQYIRSDRILRDLQSDQNKICTLMLFPQWKHKTQDEASLDKIRESLEEKLGKFTDYENVFTCTHKQT